MAIRDLSFYDADSKIPAALLQSDVEVARSLKDLFKNVSFKATDVQFQKSRDEYVAVKKGMLTVQTRSYEQLKKAMSPELNALFTSFIEGVAKEVPLLSYMTVADLYYLLIVSIKDTVPTTKKLCEQLKEFDNVEKAINELRTEITYTQKLNLVKSAKRFCPEDETDHDKQIGQIFAAMPASIKMPFDETKKNFLLSPKEVEQKPLDSGITVPDNALGEPRSFSLHLQTVQQHLDFLLLFFQEAKMDPRLLRMLFFKLSRLPVVMDNTTNLNNMLKLLFKDVTHSHLANQFRGGCHSILDFLEKYQHQRKESSRLSLLVEMKKSYDDDFSYEKFVAIDEEAINTAETAKSMKIKRVAGHIDMSAIPRIFNSFLLHELNRCHAVHTRTIDLLKNAIQTFEERLQFILQIDEVAVHQAERFENIIMATGLTTAIRKRKQLTSAINLPHIDNEIEFRCAEELYNFYNNVSTALKKILSYFEEGRLDRLKCIVDKVESKQQLTHKELASIFNYFAYYSDFSDLIKYAIKYKYNEIIDKCPDLKDEENPHAEEFIAFSTSLVLLSKWLDTIEEAKSLFIHSSNVEELAEKVINPSRCREEEQERQERAARAKKTTKQKKPHHRHKAKNKNKKPHKKTTPPPVIKPTDPDSDKVPLPISEEIQPLTDAESKSEKAIALLQPTASQEYKVEEQKQRFEKDEIPDSDSDESLNVEEGKLNLEEQEENIEQDFSTYAYKNRKLTNQQKKEVRKAKAAQEARQPQKEEEFDQTLYEEVMDLLRFKKSPKTRNIFTILYKQFGFQKNRQRGSHVILSRGSQQLTVPAKPENKRGTLHAIFKTAINSSEKTTG